MNAGMLRDRIDVLTLEQGAGGYEWKQTGGIWGAAELQDRQNIFSSVGIGVRSVKITIRNRDITLYNAVRWNGRHCFLTNISLSKNRLYLELTAALVTIQTCSVSRTSVTLDALNRPVTETPSSVSFPGVLTEKYMGKETVIPMDSITARYVLVTPKPVVLSSGELVTVGGNVYAVEVCHVLDEYKNEYEIVRMEDA